MLQNWVHYTKLIIFNIVSIFIFIAAAIFTPPDVVTQILLGIPLCLLYLLGVLFAHIFRKRGMVIEDVEGDDVKIFPYYSIDMIFFKYFIIS